MKQTVIFALTFMFSGCNSTDDSFMNANLDETETAWTQEAMNELCQESNGCCCTSLSDSGDNTIVMVSEIEMGAVGVTHAKANSPLGQLSPSYIYILNTVSTDKLLFKSIVKHELIHHCTRNPEHLQPGNIMSAFTGEFPKDGKLTDEDRTYVCK
jgi:hypothetical protein